MSVFLSAASIILTVTSMAYSYHNAAMVKKAQRRAKEEAERKAELSKGFQYVDEGNARALPIVYGRNKIGGTRVYTYVTDGVADPNTGPEWFDVFECKKHMYASAKIAKVLRNTQADWSGTWSISTAYDSDFLTTPGWVVTAEADNTWKFPSRVYNAGGAIGYAPPGVDYVFCPFKKVSGNVVYDLPPNTLTAMGFSFPYQVGNIRPFIGGMTGSKRQTLFVQQALCHNGLHKVHTIDVDQKPYNASVFEIGLQINVFRHGTAADPWMTHNDPTRTHARFTNVAYATGIFVLNRDDPQFQGPPEMQFYVDGFETKWVENTGGNYQLSTNTAYTNNPALVLLDYLMSTAYGKGVNVANIDLESFYKAAHVCDTVVISNAAKRGSLWLANSAQRDIKLYECNITLDSGANIRDNIQKILDTMSFAYLVWSDGQYSLNLPYAHLWNSTKTFKAGDIVQYGTGDQVKLYRCVYDGWNHTPGSSGQWVEDVIPTELKYINDDQLENNAELNISWPNADTKLNFVTSRFLNEDKDFSEDTISWPNKASTNPADTVYADMFAEDNNVPLETEIYVTGCTTPYHALAFAEQRVRASRTQVNYSFTASSQLLSLEPGDLFGFSSVLYNVPYTILRADNIEIVEGGSVKVSASTFDANMLAWNVDDSVYQPANDPYESYYIKQAYNLQITAGTAASKVSNYVLSWSAPNDARVTRYLVQYTTDTISNVTDSSVWTEVGTVSSTSIELPPIEGTFTFTVISMTSTGRKAPIRNRSDGSEWPLLQATLSAAFLQTTSTITANLTNDNATIVSDADGVVMNANYAGSGTDIACYQGDVPLVYDGVGTTNGTWRVEASGANVVNITRGAITAHPTDSMQARVADASGMTADSAYIDFSIIGTSITGVPFNITRRQTFSKLKIGAALKIHEISLSSTVMFKYSTGPTITGAHSTVTAYGVELSGDTSVPYGYLTYTLGSGTESAVNANSISITPANGAGISSVTFKLYDTSSKTTLLDTAVVPIVFTGANAVGIGLSNAAHAIPCDDTGLVLSYASSGTDVWVYDGANPLAYDGVGTSPGTWRVTNTPTGISITTLNDLGNFARYGDLQNMTADVASITYTAIGMTFAGVSFSVTATQTITKVKSGANAEYVYVDVSAPVIKKDSPSATLAGVHTNITATGKHNSGGTVTSFGYLTIQSNLDTVESNRSAGSITTSIANNAGISSYTIRLYETAVSTVVLDTETVPVVFKGDKGSGSVAVSLSNATHALPSDLQGNVLDYSNSGTVIYVYEGATRLVYDGVGTSNGTWAFTRSATGITANGSVVDNGDYATVGDHSNMLTETASVDYIITGKSSEGIAFSITSTQTLLKSRRGTTPIVAQITNDIVVFSTDAIGTVPTYTGTGTVVSVYEGTTKLVYNGVGTANGTYTVSAVGTSITPSNSITQINGTDANYGTASNMTADTAKIVFTVTGKSADGTGFVTTATQTFTKSKQGLPGTNGNAGDKVAIVYMYQWSTVQPNGPTANSTYTWATGAHTNYTGANNWQLVIPPNPGTPGLALWQVERTLTVPGTTVATSVDWSVDAVVSNLSLNGTSGIDGLKTADAVLYMWSVTIPSAPTGTNLWTWSTLTFDAVSAGNTAAGWTKTVPAPITGYTLYAAIVKLSDTAAANSTTIVWTSARLNPLSYAGANGAQGPQGPQGPTGPQGPQGPTGATGSGTPGLSYRMAYAVSATPTASNFQVFTYGSSTLPSPGSWSLSGSNWTTNTQVPVAGQYLWQSDGIYDPSTTQTIWSTPYWSSLKVGSLSAITANAGTINAGVLQNPAGTFVIDLSNGTITISV